MSIPPYVIDDLFSQDCNEPDIAINHISEEIEKLGFITQRHRIVGNHISIPFKNGSLNGTVIVNRSTKKFIAEATIMNPTDVDRYPPICGDWSNVIWYLSMLRSQL